MRSEFLCLTSETAWSRGVLIVVAHPDDETIGAGGAIPHLPVSAIVLATDGAPEDRRWWGDPSLPSREAYAQIRRAEFAAALAIAGIGVERVRTFGLQDQRATFHLPQLTEGLARIIHELQPGVILTHPYEGGHPDHDAVAFAVHTASKLLDREPPVILEFTSYHARVEGVTVVGSFLPLHDQPVLASTWPAAVCSGGNPGDESDLQTGTGRAGTHTEIAFLLSDDDRGRKQRMMQCFATQTDVLTRRFPVARVERFRIAPEYDFTRPPHGGTLKYERLDWGITGAGWCARAAAALDVLQVEPH
jgi:LmbE family N-acetylglucosaminyl deacetylase